MKVPALQFVVSLTEPTAQNLPAPQATHCVSLVAPIAPLYVPPLHGSGALAPSGQNDPGVHGRQNSWLGSSWNMPPSQFTQEPILAVGATVPGLHALCLVLPGVA